MANRKCVHCGKDFNVPPSKNERICCSYDCRRAYRQYNQTEERSCSVCGALFISAKTTGKAHLTCSKVCADIAKAKRPISFKSAKVDRVCLVCGKTFQAFPSRKGLYCSRPCADIGNTKSRIGRYRKSTLVQCLYCGKHIRKFPSRHKEDQRPFCNTDCYHAWDALYKSSPDMLAKLTQRLQDGFGKPSKLEDRVADWFDTHHITYDRQVPLKTYSMDFCVGSVYIEVQGCYWHGCSTHHADHTPQQKRQVSRDKSKATYCRNRDIPLLIIWEHDIDNGDFSALHILLDQFATPEAQGGPLL